MSLKAITVSALGVPASIVRANSDDHFFDLFFEDLLAPADYLVGDIEDDSSLSTSPLSVSSSSSSDSLATFVSISDSSTLSTFSAAASCDGDVLKSAYRKRAVQRWLEKRARRLSNNSKKRPYVARSAIALRRKRTSGGKFVKSVCKFVPAGDVD